MLKCTINGKEFQVKPGTTIIEAMYQNNIKIAHYCYHPGLSVAGVCRLCMVEIKGNPRVQIACNTQITEGMEINNTSQMVQDAVKWGLDFHLINHPLDCPICDQAGECGLQEQYMEYGQYNPEMAEHKVKKHKVVDLGPRVVLDSERCILCARCVRFTDEVTKTNELGIFNRGDRAEVGTFNGKTLDNKYSTNVVDICPVGALTSKDFRFKQRVWFLKDTESICNGCSTGCKIKFYYNKEGVFRVKPAHSEVNGYWMCDDGRDIYKFINKEHRLLDAEVRASGKSEYLLAAKAVSKLIPHLQGNSKSALVLTGQYTTEEYELLVQNFKQVTGSSKVYHWKNNSQKFEEFDGLLIRGDKNPNTKGLLQVLAQNQVQATWDQLEESLNKSEIETLIVAAPENQAVYPDLSEKIKLFAKAKKLVWLSSVQTQALASVADVVQIPMKSYFEKDGHFVNHAGLQQKIQKAMELVPNALCLKGFAKLIQGQDLQTQASVVTENRISNEFSSTRGEL